jgi:hypothetical protein
MVENMAGPIAHPRSELVEVAETTGSPLFRETSISSNPKSSSSAVPTISIVAYAVPL